MPACSPIICCATAANAAEADLNQSRLEVRRSRRYTAAQLLVAAAFLGLALWSLARGYEAGQASRSQLFAGGFFAFLLACYAWSLVMQLRDVRPLLTVAPEGLYLPAAREAPLPWRELRRIVCRPALLAKGRIEFQVSLETYASLKLGSRLFGDAIVRRSAARGEFAVLMQAGDRRALDVFVAIRQYWTPPG